MDPISLVQLCKQNCTQKDLPLFQEDYQNFHSKIKGNAPLKQFSALSDQEKNDYYKYTFYDNKLNEVSNEQLQYYLFCSILENGSNQAKTLLQEKLDMQPSQSLNCRNIQALKQNENNKSFIESIQKMPKSFKPFSKLIKTENDDESIDSNSTTDDDEDSKIVKRFESNEKVLKVQQILKKQGANIEVDGVLGHETENAVRDYQKKNNIFEDGLITNNLIYKLEGKEKNDEDKATNKIGGVDLKASLKEVTHIRGVKFNLKSQLKFLVDKKEKLEFSGVDSDDLALCLRVYYDTTIKNKVISFSLDPWEEKNPEGEFQKKVLYPDILEKKQILAGSRFSELMFECDYLLKQMSLGLQPDSKTPFVYPQELVKLGLKPLATIIEEQNLIPQASKQNWSRLWLVCRKIEGIVDANKGIFLSNDVQVTVDARQMEQDSEGRLIDKVVQDQSDPCYIFAKKFSELYPVISKNYPCFEEIKKLYRASALARWIAQNGIQIDMKKINSVCQRQFASIKKYNEKVNSIRQNQEIDFGSIERKIPVDVKIVAERSLKKSGQEVNEKNIKLAIDYLIKQNNGSSEFFDIQKGKQIQQKFVMGGVDMNCQISPISVKPTTPQTNKAGQQNLPAVSFSKAQSVANTPQSKQPVQQISAATKEKVKKEEQKVNDVNEQYDNDYFSQASTSIASLDDIYIQQEVKEEDFAFSISANCEKCKKSVNQLEQRYPIEQKYYCSVHHPYSCFYCGELITEAAATVQGRGELYDSESFKNKQVMMHMNCNFIFQNKCIDKANFDKQNSEISRINNSILTQIQKNLPGKKSLKELTLKKGVTFCCELCKKYNRDSTHVICNLCGLVNQAQANAYLKESFSQQK